MYAFLRTLAPLAVALSACGTPDAPPAARPAAESQAPPDTLGYPIPYTLAEPDARLRLDRRLREISGLTWLSNGHLGAVQDEDGDFFELDPETGRILSVRRFYNNGDYEGVEQVGATVWIVESDGDLYRYSGSGEAEKLETGLERANDVEGLGYDASRNRLLLACKESPGAGLAGVRAVYAYDLDAGRLTRQPVYTLDREALDVGGATFKPSGLAVHPETHEVYILSGVLKAVVVLTPEGERRAAISLPSHLYPQPEGIAFAPDGTLYISNEGAGGSATLLRFSPQPLP